MYRCVLWRIKKPFRPISARTSIGLHFQSECNGVRDEAEHDGWNLDADPRMLWNRIVIDGYGLSRQPRGIGVNTRYGTCKDDMSPAFSIF